MLHKLRSVLFAVKSSFAKIGYIIHLLVKKMASTQLGKSVADRLIERLFMLFFIIFLYSLNNIALCRDRDDAAFLFLLIPILLKS